MLKDDPVVNVLYIDLAKKRFQIKNRQDLFEKYIGGIGVATRLLFEECPEGCDPLGDKNPVILAIGPMTSLFPLASKTVAVFKSPHNGNLGESHCGGRSAVAMRMAGFGAIVIKGASDIPVYLSIHGNKVYFRDASSIWGLNAFTTGRIVREIEKSEGLRTIMRIGRAGEKQISYACVTTETYRHFGRLGMGAVLGSKKIKAIVISGKRSIPVSDGREYRKAYDELYQAAVTSPAIRKYHDLGTAGNIMPLNDIGGLPTRNLKEARFEDAAAISGETFAENYLGKRIACSHCPVGCIHIAALREPYEDEPYFYKTSMFSYDYEPVYALGSMLGGSDARGLLRLMHEVELLGLDVMSAGVVLAWATEAQERGIISDKETMGIKLAWGDYSAYRSAVNLIAEQPNDFFMALGRGVAHASSVYGGEDFALSFGGNEMPGYHTGPAAHIGSLIGSRHSHLDNAGYSIDQKSLLAGEQPAPEDIAKALLSEERWRQVISSLVICFFSRGIYTPEIVSRCLRLSGYDLSPEKLNLIGADIHREKYRFKIREGFSLDSITIPKRILETMSPLGKLKEDYIRQALAYVRKEMA